MRLAWSNLAKQELLDVKRYSVDRWGRDIALRYLEDMRDGAKRVAENPDGARKLKGPLRIVRVRSHCLIVHVDESAGRVTIARVLHVAMDIERYLP